MNTVFLGLAVATVLTACGIETKQSLSSIRSNSIYVATVLTACGIETRKFLLKSYSIRQLQQCLPLAVLKRIY